MEVSKEKDNTFLKISFNEKNYNLYKIFIHIIIFNSLESNCTLTNVP